MGDGSAQIHNLFKERWRITVINMYMYMYIYNNNTNKMKSHIKKIDEKIMTMSFLVWYKYIIFIGQIKILI